MSLIYVAVFCLQGKARIQAACTISKLGTANGMYPAHLHFEIRASDGADIGAGYGVFFVQSAQSRCRGQGQAAFFCRANFTSDVSSC